VVFQSERVMDHELGYFGTTSAIHNTKYIWAGQIKDGEIGGTRSTYMGDEERI